MSGKTISFKVTEQEVAKLDEIRAKLRAESIHTAARDLLVMALHSTTSSSSSDLKILALEATLLQLTSQAEQAITFTEKLGVYIGMLSELLLINLGNVSPEGAAETIKSIFESVFGEIEGGDNK
jgi:hypothetical protein